MKTTFTVMVNYLYYKVVCDAVSRHLELNWIAMHLLWTIAWVTREIATVRIINFSLNDKQIQCWEGGGVTPLTPLTRTDSDGLGC